MHKERWGGRAQLRHGAYYPVDQRSKIGAMCFCARPRCNAGFGPPTTSGPRTGPRRRADTTKPFVVAPIDRRMSNAHHTQGSRPCCRRPSDRDTRLVKNCNDFESQSKEIDAHRKVNRREIKLTVLERRGHRHASNNNNIKSSMHASVVR